jgi:hypothetical protein
MSLRELAESDLACTLEDPDGAGSSIALIDPDGNEYAVFGTAGDVGLLIEPDSGESARSRSIVCCVRVTTLAGKTRAVPSRGWRARILDLQGAPVNLFVQGNDPDRTLGVYRLTLGLDAEEEE